MQTLQLELNETLAHMFQFSDYAYYFYIFFIFFFYLELLRYLKQEQSDGTKSNKMSV